MFTKQQAPPLTPVQCNTLSSHDCYYYLISLASVRVVVFVTTTDTVHGIFSVTETHNYRWTALVQALLRVSQFDSRAAALVLDAVLAHERPGPAEEAH